LKTDEGLSIEIAELRSERRRVFRGGGPFRSEQIARLDSWVDEAKAIVEQTIAVAAMDVPPLEQLRELHALHMFVEDPRPDVVRCTVNGLGWMAH
jgi:hypothetical protein